MSGARDAEGTGTAQETTEEQASASSSTMRGAAVSSSYRVPSARR